MNVQDKLLSMLIERGMFESQANDVIELVKVSGKAGSMRDNWLKDIDGYPEIVVSVLWAITKDIAIKWVEDNKPDAWFKGLLQA